MDPSHGWMLVYMRTVTSLQANALPTLPLKPEICKLQTHWWFLGCPFRHQGPTLCWSCCDVNVRLKERHYSCRKTFAAILASKAVMCQALWKCVVHLPKIFLHLERVWRAYPTEQSHVILWIFA